MTTVPLVIPGFLAPQACARLRADYAAALAGGLKPRGRLTTDAPLSAVCPDTAAELAGRCAAGLDGWFPGLPPLRPDYVAYTRCLPGGAHPLHADAVRPDGAPNHTPHRVATAMVYLSDGRADFDGGTIRFPGLGLDITPEPGLLVGFLTGWDHRHEVPSVTRGARDAVAIWFRSAAT